MGGAAELGEAPKLAPPASCCWFERGPKERECWLSDAVTVGVDGKEDDCRFIVVAGKKDDDKGANVMESV